MFKKLRTQLTTVCAFSTGLVLVASTIIVMLFTASTMRDQAEQAFAANVNSVFYYLSSQEFIDQAWLSKTEADNGMMIRVNIRDRELERTGQHPLMESLTDQAREYARGQLGFDYRQRPRYTSQPESVEFRFQADGKEYRAVVASISYGDEWIGLTILKDAAPENARLFKVRLVTLLCLFVALWLLVLFSHFFIGYALKPVEENRKRQTEFVSAASHELRSPLAAMSASAGVIAICKPEEAKEYAAKIAAECVRLSRLVGDLLRLATADSGAWRMNAEKIHPETIVIGMAERFEDLAAQKGISLEADLPDEQFPALYVDENRIEQLLGILIDNAMGYTPAGGCVKLGAYEQRGNVFFTVTDNGPGIPDEAKERIFERFYRGDEARTDKEHFGIGLSVAREIALLHKGSLSVRDAEGGGAQFVLKLPIKKPKSLSAEI